MLTIDELRVAYGTTVAVRQMTMSLAPGEAVALLGANGAGKTSTLRAIAGLERYDGSVLFDGEEVRRKGPLWLARRGLIMVPEGRRVFAGLTAEENITFGRRAARGRDAQYDLDAVYDLFPPLVPLRKRLAYALSGGEQQMVAIGRALVAAPRLLLVDEPSLGLSPRIADVVTTALSEIAAGTALLIVEQNVDLALRVCEQVRVMAHGEVVLSGTADGFADRSRLLDTYLGGRVAAAAADPTLHPTTPETSTRT